MSNQPLMSIIVPTYNRESFIVEAIQSVLEQTYSNWELIIVDDGSTDNTLETIKDIITDDRISYYHQKNQGQSVARNVGINKSTGEYICFLDSDNKWLQNRLEISVKVILNNPQVDIVYGDSISIDIQGHEISRHVMKKYSGHVTKELIKDNFISMNAAIAKKKCFDEMGAFNEKDRLAEDYELWLRFSTKYTFMHIPEFMALYRVMEDQLSTDKDKRLYANECIIRKFKETYPQVLSTVEWGQGFSFFYVRKSNYERSVKRYKQSLIDVLKAIRQYPFWQGPWRSLVKLIIFRK